MSFRNKLIFGFLCILLIIGSYSAHLTYEVLKFKLETQLTIKGKNITESTGIALGNLILTNDYIKIQKVINSIMATDDEIQYLIIKNQNNDIISHSFQNSIPSDLIKLTTISTNTPDDFASYKLNADGKKIRHVTYLINKGKGGSVSIGISYEKLENTLLKLQKKIIITTILCMIAGIFLVYFLSSLIIKPILILKNATNEIGKGNFDNLQLDIKSNDEFKVLANSINKMATSLKKYIENEKNIEKEKLSAKHMATIGEMSASLAHEINNPIDGIQRMINLINDETDNPKHNEYFTLILENLKKIEFIIKQLLTYARYRVSFSFVDINELIKKEVTIAQTLTSLNIQFKLNLSDNIGPLYIDKIGMSIIISNLLINSIGAFVNNDNNEICITTEINKDKDTCQITIKDNGKGIPKEYINNIFDPFFSTKDKEKGSGLGLSIAQNIIKQHSGTITVNLPEQGGTEFVISLPNKKNIAISKN